MDECLMDLFALSLGGGVLALALIWGWHGLPGPDMRPSGGV